MENSLGLYIVGGFLLINLLLGLWAGRGIQTVENFSIGKTRWSAASIAMSILATGIGGGFVFVTSRDIVNDGMMAFFMLMARPIAYVVGYFVIKKVIVKYDNVLSIGDFISELYGKKAKIIAGFLSFAYNAILTAVQIKVLGYIFSEFLGMDSSAGLWSSGIIIAIYTAFGGMNAVIATDILQFVFIFGVLSVLSTFAIQNVGGMKILLESLPASSINPLLSNNFYVYLSVFFVDVLFMEELSEPPKLERLLMAKDYRKVKKALILCGIGAFVAGLIILLISLSTKVLLGNDNVITQSPVLYIFKNCLPNSMQNIVSVGLIAVILSSGDSYLHSAGLALGKDFIPSILRFKPTVSLIRISTLIVGLICVLIASKLEYLIFNIGFIVGILAVSLSPAIFWGILGLKGSQKQFFSSVIVGILSYFILSYSELESLSILISAALSIITLLIVHVYQNQRLIIGEENENLFKYKYKYPIFNYKILHFFQFCRDQVDKHGASYALFSSFYILVNLIPYLLWDNILINFTYQVLALKFISGALCCLLLTHSIWPNVLKKYLPAFWYFTLTYCLPFLSTIMLVLSNGAIEYTINIAISIMFLLLLVDWISALLIGLVGVAAAILFYKYILNIETSFEFSTTYLLGYQILFGTLIGLLFARKKHSKISNVIKKAEIQTRLKLHITESSQRIAKIIKDSNKSIFGNYTNPKQDIENLRALIESNNFSTKNLKEAIDNLERFVHIESASIAPYMVLHGTTIEVQALAKEFTDLCNSIDLESVNIYISTKSKKIQCDVIGIVKVIGKLVADYYNKLKDENWEDDIDIYITISDSSIIYNNPSDAKVSRIVEAINIVISDVENYDEKLKAGSFNKQLLDPEKIQFINADDYEMIDVEKTIDAHYGVITKSTNINEFAWSCVLPKKLYDVRPITLDILEPNSYDLYYNWPDAEILEEKLIEKLQTNFSDFNIEKIRQAIDTIKIYHRHQGRKSGEPYYMHPMSVAMIAVDIMNDKNSSAYETLQKNKDTVILTALLHDILEDTYYKAKNLMRDYGADVQYYVQSVTKIDFKDREILLQNYDAFSKLIDQEPITICVKIADRIHNLQTIDGHPKKEKRIAVAEETLAFFVHAARKYEMTELAEKLTSMCNYIIKNGKIEGWNL